MPLKSLARIVVTLGIVALPVWAHPQVQIEARRNPGNGASSREEEPGARGAGELEQLKSRVGELQSVIENQAAMLAELQKRLDKLERDAQTETAGLKSGEPSPVESAPPPAPEPPVTAVAETHPPAQDKPRIMAGWDNGRAVLRSEDGHFETQITGYAQLDARIYSDGDHPPNTFLVRRARLALEGKLQQYFDYKVEGDFADVAGTLLRDFYVNVHRIDEAQFRAGQFRVPISQEELRSDAYQDFVERSLVNNLVPSRSPGIAVTGVLNKGTFEYQVGAFNGKGLLGLNTSGTPEAAARLRFNPWKNTKSFWAKGFIFGGAFTQGANGGGLSVRGQTESRSIFFFLPDTINGKFIRANGELTWMLGPAAIRAEYDQTNQRRDNLGPDDTNLPGVVGKGFVAQFTYLLTGESKPEAGAVTPKRNLFDSESGRDGFGAWELKFRYSSLEISDATEKSNRAESFFFGTNWYLNRHVRYMLDFGFERFRDPLRTPNPGDRTFFVTLNRVQVSF
jgi:phosphate-selective porin OprO/OprP